MLTVQNDDGVSKYNGPASSHSLYLRPMGFSFWFYYDLALTYHPSFLWVFADDWISILVFFHFKAEQLQNPKGRRGDMKRQVKAKETMEVWQSAEEARAIACGGLSSFCTVCYQYYREYVDQTFTHLRIGCNWTILQTMLTLTIKLSSSIFAPSRPSDSNFR